MKSVIAIIVGHLFIVPLLGFGSLHAQLKAPRSESDTWSFGVIGGVVDAWQSGSYRWSSVPFMHGSGISGTIALSAEMRFPSRSIPEFGIELLAGWKGEMVKGETITTEIVSLSAGSHTGAMNVPVRFNHAGSLRISSVMIAPALTMHFGSIFVLGVGGQLLIPIEAHMAQSSTLVDTVVDVPGLGRAEVQVVGDDPRSFVSPDRVRDDAHASIGASLHLGATIPLFSRLSIAPRLGLVVPITPPLADDDVNLTTAEGLLGIQWAL